MKTIVITGATSGIGLAIVKALVQRKDFVIAIGRNEASCLQAYAEVAEEKRDNLIYLPCDLSDQDAIRSLAIEIKKQLGNQGLDVLINNAAAVPRKRCLTDAGIELQFAVNHLAPFLLTHLLFPLLKQNKGRVIASASRSHSMVHLNFKNLTMKRWYFILSMYGRTKLCNVLFTYEFNRRYLSQDVIAYALDPGMVKSGIGRKRTNRFIAWVWETYTRKGQEPEEVAPHYLELIDDPKHLEEPYYYKYGEFIEPADDAKNQEIAKKIWDISCQMTEVKNFG